MKKRVLSLCLAALLLLSFFPLSARAEFTDADDILNSEAADLLASLGVFEGYPDGSFQPLTTINRAEMAAIIYRIVTGETDADAYEGISSPFTDVEDHWAKGCITYCANLGIIAGKGSGIFDPAADVTTVEAAKMLLVALGYDAAAEGFLGADWAANTSDKATKVGLYTGLEIEDNIEALTRDSAARMMYNALDASIVTYTDGVAIAGSETFLQKHFEVLILEGVVVANDFASLTKYSPNAEGCTTFYNPEGLFQNASGSQLTHSATTLTLSVDTGEELLGQRVKVYVKPDTDLSKSMVLGEPIPTEDNNVFTATQLVEDEKALKYVSGLTLGLNTKYYVNYEGMSLEWALADIHNVFTASLKTHALNPNGVGMTVIDNNGDNLADYVFYTQYALSQITAYSESDEKLTLYHGPDAVAAIFPFSALTGAEDVSRGDLVLYRTVGGITHLTQPEILTGELDSLTANYLKIDSVQYDLSAALNALSPNDDDYIPAASAASLLNEEVDLYLDPYGYAVAMKKLPSIIIVVPTEKTYTGYVTSLYKEEWSTNEWFTAVAGSGGIFGQLYTDSQPAYQVGDQLTFTLDNDGYSIKSIKDTSTAIPVENPSVDSLKSYSNLLVSGDSFSQYMPPEQWDYPLGTPDTTSEKFWTQVEAGLSDNGYVVEDGWAGNIIYSYTVFTYSTSPNTALIYESSKEISSGTIDIPIVSG